MSILRANTITDVAGTGLTDFPYGVNLPATNALPDPENRIINGAFDFWQRGTSGIGGGYVAADRWLVNAGGGTVTQSRQSHTIGDKFGVNSPRFYLQQTVSGQSAAGDFAITQQRIENVRSYAGETITVLGWARRSSGSGNIYIEGTQRFGTGGSPSALTPITGQTVSLTTSWAPFAVVLTVPSIAGKTLGTSDNDSFGLQLWTSAGSDFNARTNSLGLQTIGVDLWGIHIKRGTHTAAATEFYKAPELGPELARCQRYYFSRPTFVTSASAGVLAYVCFPTPMRVVPAISGGGAGFGVQSGTASIVGADVFQSSAAAQTLVFDAEL
jgi:hypothetical protein